MSRTKRPAHDIEFLTQFKVCPDPIRDDPNLATAMNGRKISYNHLIFFVFHAAEKLPRQQLDNRRSGRRDSPVRLLVNFADVLKLPACRSPRVSKRGDGKLPHDVARLRSGMRGQGVVILDQRYFMSGFSRTSYFPFAAAALNAITFFM